MMDTIILDKRQTISCATRLDGEYGIKDTVLGVPVKLGRDGIEQIIELELMAEKKAALAKAAEAVRELINIMKLS